jgi:hypothetical protein
VQVLDLTDHSVQFLARGTSPDWANVPIARELLPDLDQWAPTNVYVAHHGTRRVLAFQSAVANVGRGPIWIEGRRAPKRATMTAWQLVRRSDSSVHRLPSAGYLRYDVSPTHSHWHFHPFERYELRKPGGLRALARDHKQGFCFGDRHAAKRTFTRVTAGSSSRTCSPCGRERRSTSSTSIPRSFTGSGSTSAESATGITCSFTR